MKMLKSLEFPEGALLVCVALAIMFGLLALLGYWEDSRFLKRAVPATGEVVGVRIRTEVEQKKNGGTSKSHHFTPVVSFADANDRSIEFAGRYETQQEKQWKTGMTVRVLYPIDDPAAARIDDPSQIYASYRTMRFVMFLCLIVGGVIFGVAKFEANRKERPVYRTDDEARRAFFGE
jgi:hypothetical protein